MTLRDAQGRAVGLWHWWCGADTLRRAAWGTYPSKCDGDQDYRSSDALRYFRRGGPTCPKDVRHGAMALTERGKERYW